MAKATAPTGVTLVRNGNNWTATWKRSENYTWQTVYMAFYYDKQWAMSLTSGPNGATPAKATSKVFTWDKNSFYPKTNKKVNTAYVYARGARGRRTFSNWATATYKMWAPPKPELTVSHSSEHENSTTFNFKIDWEKTLDKNTGGVIFTNFQWWTSLLPNSELEPEQVTNWQETGVTTDDVDDTSKTITETQAFTGTNSYTRYFKVVARGPKGDSVPAYAKYVYAAPNAPRNVDAIALSLDNGAGYRVSVQWTADESNARPIDDVYLEYAIEVPVTTHKDSGELRKITMSAPNITSWTKVSTFKDASKENGAVDGDTFVIDQQLPKDSWIFVRVVTKHDNKTSPSNIVFVKNGGSRVRSVPNVVSMLEPEGTGLEPLTGGDYKPVLSSPSSLAANVSGNIASITVDNNSEVTESVVAIYFRSDVNQTPRLIGIKPANSTAAISVQLPEEGNAFSFGVKAFLADYTPITPKVSGVTEYAFSNIKAESEEIIWDERAVPKPPNNIGLSSPRAGVVRITWNWTWTEANGVEISWANHDDAWESTEEPTVYTVEQQRASAWNISGLDVGIWYFRIRLYKTDGDATTYGTYSETKSFKLVSSPATPVLTISPSPAIVRPDGKITCYWVFTATDGDEQIQADICEATVDADGAITYGAIIGRANNEQFKTFKVSDLGWTEGSKHFLAVRIVTASGEASGNWSIPKPVQILNGLTASIVSSSLKTITVVDDEDQGISHQQLSLTKMPLTVSASGAGEGGSVTYIIERDGDYQLDRPDENEFKGFDGETIAVVQKSATNTNGSADYTASIGLDNLVGQLDDGAYYKLIAIVQDSYGQTAQTEQRFAVHWTHQAVKPSATIESDEENLATFITPIKPKSGYSEGDSCDIYRLSIDKPELLISNAKFGTKYVDPYPTLGNHGGHRVVYKTVNGDYITAGNEFAWVDYNYENGDLIDRFATIIDFEDDRAILPYDLSLSTRWTKDFTQTKYLGGSIQGDWNPGVDRTLSVRTRVAVREDSELVNVMRRLATYSGICHVRTPDGSSFSANIDLTEDREERKINMIASFSLEITRVDASGFDGLTYADWIRED